MPNNQGGCLCGEVRYATEGEPVRVTICYCSFCQRATGSASMVEPIFSRDAFTILTGTTKTYDHRSGGSGKMVEVNFCPNCGTNVFLGFERWSDIVGIYGGTFDDPNWYERHADNSKHVFLEMAQHGTLIPAGMNTFHQHATENDGTPIEPTVFDTPHIIGPAGIRAAG